jgi:gliding motility-associated-like protein
VNSSFTFFSTVAAFTADTTEGFAPLTVLFTDHSQANAITLKWDFGDGVTYNDSVNPKYIFSTPGTYQVVLTAINGNGCKDTTVRTIVVLEIPNTANVFEIPNVFTPNNDLINDVFLVKSNNVKTFSGEVFDRWGLKVHDWKNINEGWDGRTPSGKLVTDGVFFYVMNVTFQDGSSINPTGTITITK